MTKVLKTLKASPIVDSSEWCRNCWLLTNGWWAVDSAATHSLQLVQLSTNLSEVSQRLLSVIIFASTSQFHVYRMSSKTVPTWLFALLSASTYANCKSWDVFEKFRKFATR